MSRPLCHDFGKLSSSFQVIFKKFWIFTQDKSAILCQETQEFAEKSKKFLLGSYKILQKKCNIIAKTWNDL